MIGLIGLTTKSWNCCSLLFTDRSILIQSSKEVLWGAVIWGGPLVYTGSPSKCYPETVKQMKEAGRTCFGSVTIISIAADNFHMLCRF